MKVDLNKTDLVNLVSSVSPNSMQECDTYTKIGLMRFSGNQHNENWAWVKSELMKLSENKLLKLYNKHKES